MVLYLDTETYSETPIKNGVFKYAEAVEVMLVAYALADGDVNVWDRTTQDAIPADLDAALKSDCEIVMHKSDFDRTVLRMSGVVDIPTSRITDTMVLAYSHSLPGSLDALCRLYKIAGDDAKHEDGKRLIQLFCKPRPKNVKIRRATRETHPADWEKFKAYAKSDIRATRALHKLLPKWNATPAEKEFWILDQKINDRGIPVDLKLAEAAIAAVSSRKVELDEYASEVTDDALNALTQRDALLDFILTAHNINLPDMRRATLEKMISDDDTPGELKALLQARLEASSTGDTKYKAVIRSVSSDDRLRGTKQFCGAGRTGRWAGRIFQPDNLMRPVIPKHAVETGIEALLAGCPEIVTGSAVDVIRSAVRGVVKAPAGRKLVVSDLSNIEGRAQAFLAGEGWKLKAFSDFDAGIGADLYNVAYARSFNIDVLHVTELQRQIGKVMELALGYAGGAPAFASMAANYKINLDKLVRQAKAVISAERLADATSFTDWLLKKNASAIGMSRENFIVCTALKNAWRQAHPKIVTYWTQIIDAAIAAIRNPGEVQRIPNLAFVKTGTWLRIRLPSGRNLCYPDAKVENDKSIRYSGLHTLAHKWGDVYATGGKLFENICQAFARDILAYAMPGVENAGYDIILTVHDEAVTETPDTDSFNHKTLSQLLATPPVWAKTIPLAAKGYEAYRFKKD